MIKGGIFLDIENLNRCGGWNLRFEAVKRMVEAQGVTVVRANAYVTVDREREATDPDYSKKKKEYRGVMRRSGFHVVQKQVQKYRTDEGDWVFKANADLELAIDVLTQCENLDYVLIGSGDADLVRLLRTLQARGKRVDVLSFSHTSDELRREADFHFAGYLYPGLLPSFNGEAGEERARGFMHMVNEDKGFGFITVQTGLKPGQSRNDIFVHITDLLDEMDNRDFARLKTEERVLEFTLAASEDGKAQAREVEIID